MVRDKDLQHHRLQQCHQWLRKSRAVAKSHSTNLRYEWDTRLVYFILFLERVGRGSFFWGSALEIRPRRDIEANIITYSAAISSCEKGGQWQWALLLFKDLLCKKLEGNRITYTSTISACEKGQRWQWALHFMAELHSATIKCNSMAHYAAKLWTSTEFFFCVFLGIFLLFSIPVSRATIKKIYISMGLGSLNRQWSKPASLNTNGRRRPCVVRCFWPSLSKRLSYLNLLNITLRNSWNFVC